VTELKRTVGPTQLMLYGIGSMLGAGIYGLVGKAARVMGSSIWMAFLVAMIAALQTGVSYASIYPKAAGVDRRRARDHAIDAAKCLTNSRNTVQGGGCVTPILHQSVSRCP
jgi:hypothetical protein